jgi:molybdopterin/thiamine biosynthesis adenylyltransferase
MLGTIQATEALKFITGVGELLSGTLLSFDAQTMHFRRVKLQRQKNCPICAESPAITELTDAEQAVCNL